LYEGTTGIQALDLLGRKVMLDRGKQLSLFIKEILSYCKDKSVVSNNPHKKQMNKFIVPLAKEAAKWQLYIYRIMLKVRKDRDMVGAASVDFLMYSGYISMAYMWAKMAQTAYEKIEQGEGDLEFYRSKIKTARFYYERILPRIDTHSKLMMTSPASLMRINEDQF